MDSLLSWGLRTGIIKEALHMVCKLTWYVNWHGGVMHQSNRSFNIPPRAYLGHLTPFLAREGGHLITSHRGWGIWSLTLILRYESRWFPGDGGDKLRWIQRKRLRIRDRVVENQRPTQALFHIWRCLRTIYFLFSFLFFSWYVRVFEKLKQ